MARRHAKRLLTQVLYGVSLLCLAWVTAAFTSLFATDAQSESQQEQFFLDEVELDEMRASLVMLHHYDEGEGSTTVTDSSFNGNEGTCTNCPDFSQAGVFGSAARFNGTNDVISVSDDNDLDFGTGNFTLSLWVYYLALSDRQGMMDKTDGTNGYRLYTDDDDSNSFEFTRGYFFDSGASSTNNIIANFFWYHVAAVVDSNNATLYLNTNSVGTGAVGNNANNTEDLTIGYKTHGPSSVTFLPAIIDEAAIYNIALSARQLKHLYRQGRWRHYFDQPHCFGYTCDYSQALFGSLFSPKPSKYDYLARRQRPPKIVHRRIEGLDKDG